MTRQATGLYATKQRLKAGGTAVTLMFSEADAERMTEGKTEQDAVKVIFDSQDKDDATAFIAEAIRKIARKTGKTTDEIRSALIWEFGSTARDENGDPVYILSKSKNPHYGSTHYYTRRTASEISGWILHKVLKPVHEHKDAELRKLLNGTNEMLARYGLKTASPQLIEFFVKEAEGGGTMEQEFKFTIYGRFPSLNEVLEWQNTQKGKWNKWSAEKHKLQDIVIKAIEEAGRPAMYTKPVRVHFDYYEQDARRDCDNVSGAAHKVVMDALQAAEVIRRDSPRYVTGHSDNFHVDPIRPRIEVRVYPDTEEFNERWTAFWKDTFKRIEEIEPRDTDWE